MLTFIFYMLLLLKLNMELQYIMNLQRGLTKASNSPQRLHELLSNGRYSGVVVNKRVEITGEKEDTFLPSFKTAHQSTSDFIQSVFNLRKAIQRTNMETIVNIPALGGDITLADAIIYRQQILPFLETYLSTLQRSNQSSAHLYARAEEKYRLGIDQLISATRKDSTTPLTEDELNVIIKMKDSERPVFYSCQDHLEEVRELVTFLKEELDAVLSVTNAITEIKE